MPLTADRDGLRRTAARLSAAGAGNEAAAQEGLDLLAVLAGLKPAAVLGYARADQGWRDALAEEAGRAGLAVRPCTAWISAGEFDGAPGWYAEGVAELRAKAALIAVAPDETAFAALTDGPAPVLDAAAEAALLGYPACCVAGHADWRRALHLATAPILLAAAGGDTGRARRMAAADWVPTPRDADEAARLAALLDRDVAPCTSILPCRACTADDRGPTPALSRAFRALALSCGHAAAPAEAA